MTESAFAGNPVPSATAYCAQSHLVRGRTLHQDGRLLEAIRSYEAAIRRAELEGNQPVLVEALRRLAIARHGGREFEAARKTAARSHRLATDLGDKTLTTKALNTLAGFDIDAGAHDSARERLAEALELCDGDEALRGGIEQNLAIVANMRGDHRRAAGRMGRRLWREDAARVQAVGSKRRHRSGRAGQGRQEVRAGQDGRKQ